MKQFLEIVEISENPEKNLKRFKIEVKDKKEAMDKLKTEESSFTGLTYVKRLHTCNHSEDGNNQPCGVENL